LTYTGISHGHIIQLLNHYKNKIPLDSKYIQKYINKKIKMRLRLKTFFFFFFFFFLIKSIEDKKFEYIDYIDYLLNYENENKEKLIDHINNYTNRY